MKRIIKRLSKNWDKYLLEILVIASGILLAFGMKAESKYKLKLAY